MAPAGIAAVEAAKADGSWTSLDDVEDLVEPADLTAALDADPEARARFDALPSSQRKMALYWVSTAKREPTRDKRIAAVIAAALEGRRLF